MAIEPIKACNEITLKNLLLEQGEQITIIHLCQGILMSTTAYDRKILAERVGII